MSNQTYTGITIGPIYDTMQLTSSPGGLWGASYLFSWVTRELIAALVQDEIDADRFVSPAVQWDGSQVILEGCEKARSMGVGLFHDRIIFQGDALDAVKEAKCKVAAQLADKLPFTGDRSELESWLNNYLRICAAKAEISDEENPLLVLGPILDSLELEPQYVPSQNEDPLLYLFENVRAKTARQGSSNKMLKESFLVKELDHWMLLRKDGDQIRDLQHIASNGRAKKELTKKNQLYFAILQSDGDRMGETLKKLKAEGGDLSALHSFSKNCLAFCSSAAEIIYSYGGVPIYAGGDDLLALVPLTCREDSTDAPATVLGLVDKLRECFNDVFSGEDGRPTLSVGVSIQYYKSPLYEALDRASDLLHQAKAAPGKNALRLDLQKHSGQSIQLNVNQLDKADVLPLLDKALQAANSMNAKSNTWEFLSSAGPQIERFRSLFRLAIARNSRDQLVNLIDNLFDNVGQKAFREGYLKEIENLAWAIMQNALSQPGTKASTKDDASQAYVIGQIESAIRFIHFMQEQPDANERKV